MPVTEALFALLLMAGCFGIDGTSEQSASDTASTDSGFVEIKESGQVVLSRAGLWSAIYDDGTDSLYFHRSERIITAVNIADFVPQEIHWLMMPSSSRVYFGFTQDFPSQGVVRTKLLSVLDGQVYEAYSDSTGICEPARITDLNDDGRPEVVAFIEDPSNGACVSECHIELAERFDLSLAWIQVHRLEDGVWQPNEEAFPNFYQDVAERYRMAAEWADTSEPWSCGSFGARHLQRWYERAAGLSKGG